VRGDEATRAHGALRRALVDVAMHVLATKGIAGMSLSGRCGGPLRQWRVPVRSEDKGEVEGHGGQGLR
jgi:hypothetical protein